MQPSEEPGSSQGYIEPFPLVGFETMVAHGCLCAMQLHYLESPEQMLSGGKASLPLLFTTDVARGLATALLAAADEADERSALN